LEVPDAVAVFPTELFAALSAAISEEEFCIGLDMA
jgi:hypothetical protein